MAGPGKSEETLVRQVGSAIARHRKALGLTQAHVADAIGLEKETVSRLENGAIAPTIFRLEQFAELFGCPVSALFGEYKGAVGQDAGTIERLIADLPLEDRQAILRVVGDFAAVARERDQLKEANLRQEQLLYAMREAEALREAMKDRPAAPQKRPKIL